MGFVGPDPGHAVRAAQAFEHDPQENCWITDRGNRQLEVERSNVWNVVPAPAIKIDAATHALLKVATTAPGNIFISGDQSYYLVPDNGFAVAVPV